MKIDVNLTAEQEAAIRAASDGLSVESYLRLKMEQHARERVSEVKRRALAEVGLQGLHQLTDAEIDALKAVRRKPGNPSGGGV